MVMCYYITMQILFSYNIDNLFLSRDDYSYKG